MRALHWVLLLAAAAAALARLPLAAALPKPSMARPSSERAVYDGPSNMARVEDIPYIRCQVCMLLAEQAWKQAKALISIGTPGNPVHEDRVIELVEKLTSAGLPEGQWIASVDLVEEAGGRLAVREMGRPGVCGVECKTVERAAEQIMGEHDTDVAEALFTGKKDAEQLSKWLCNELSGACSTQPPPLPKDRPLGPEFEARKEGHTNAGGMPGGPQGLGGMNVQLQGNLGEQLGMDGLQYLGEDTDVDAIIKASMAKDAQNEQGQAADEL